MKLKRFCDDSHWTNIIKNEYILLGLVVCLKSMVVCCGVVVIATGGFVVVLGDSVVTTELETTDGILDWLGVGLIVIGADIVCCSENVGKGVKFCIVKTVDATNSEEKGVLENVDVSIKALLVMCDVGRIVVFNCDVESDGETEAVSDNDAI